MNWYWSALAGFIVTAVAILALCPLAVTLNLIDRPGGRKIHQGEVPIVGGLAMFIGVVVGLGLLRLTSSTPVAALTVAFGLLVLVGLFDDRHSLSPWIRLPVHAAVAFVLLEFAGCRVLSIGDAFGLGAVNFSGLWVYVVTLVLVAAAINAFNMLDGMDGLAGMTACVVLCTLGYVAWRTGDIETLAICAVLVGATAGFLLFNLPLSLSRTLRCFMGDAGSTFLGVAVAWAMVRVSQSSVSSPTGEINAVTALWIGGLPLFELIWSFARRIGRGRSPFVGDNGHFHHVLMRTGFSNRGALGMLLLLSVALAAIGLGLESAGVPEYWSLTLLIMAGAFVVSSVYRARLVLDYLPRPAREMEAE